MQPLLPLCLPQVFTALVYASHKCTGSMRRRLFNIMRELLRQPWWFLRAGSIPETHILKDLKLLLQKQYKKEVGAVMHSKFVQALTEMFLAVKDAEMYWKTALSMQQTLVETRSTLGPCLILIFVIFFTNYYFF